MQNKRFANIDLEEWEKSKQNPTILRAKNNFFRNCQEWTYWMSHKASRMDLYFLLDYF